ncbi:MAG: YcaO-like family protein [Actinomycetota bacterium]|nr:YcaO-like family protein [Actinomycetota bacterium]
MSTVDDLVDPAAGVLTWVRPLLPDPVAPPSLQVWASHSADVDHVLGVPADRFGTGTSFDAPDAARSAAIGEAIERYCANIVPTDLVVASHEELSRSGPRSIDPTTLALYSESQYAEAGCPFVPFRPELRVRWAEGTSLVDGRPCLVPASLVWMNYFLGPRRDDPPTNFAMFAGVAAGPDPAWARRSALEELIERDATMVWWHSGGDPIAVEIDDPSLAAQLAPPPTSPVEVTYVSIPNRLGVPVIGAFLRDHDDEVVALGVAARARAADAVRKAAAEAWSLRTYALGLADPEGLIWRAAQAALIDGSALKPFRADRRYADDYRDDFRDVTDLSCQSQIYLDRRMHHWCDRIRRPGRSTALSEIAAVDGDPLTAYLSLLVDVDVHPVVVDLTTPDVAACGLSVVRVVAPGLYSNPPAAFPFLGGTRLRTEPRTLGLAERDLAEDELVLAPLPHT